MSATEPRKGRTRGSEGLLFLRRYSPEYQEVPPLEDLLPPLQHFSFRGNPFGIYKEIPNLYGKLNLDVFRRRISRGCRTWPDDYLSATTRPIRPRAPIPAMIKGVLDIPEDFVTSSGATEGLLAFSWAACLFILAISSLV